MIQDFFKNKKKKRFFSKLTSEESITNKYSESELHFKRNNSSILHSPINFKRNYENFSICSVRSKNRALSMKLESSFNEKMNEEPHIYTIKSDTDNLTLKKNLRQTIVVDKKKSFNNYFVNHNIENILKKFLKS